LKREEIIVASSVKESSRIRIEKIISCIEVGAASLS
jgi:hypothetical protein